MSLRNDNIIWVSKVRERLEQLGPESIKNLIYDVRTPVSQGGHMPVVSGNLRNSPEVSFTHMPVADRVLDPNKPLTDPMGKINPKILNMQPGQVVSIGFRAIYAPLIELKYAFVRLAAQNWRRHVDEALKVIKARTP